ncbi:HK97 gp10 family phage protein [Clostridium formicaceticum]|uniref:HK97 gp10 family phage protein n=1 Tax=Clostridium formicaceticum TaxID=1497 RepID=A0AAC9RK17_9CLOT|nr:HK97 gp10 family phage protein [Clostridium formicaceticum]AOY76681.1 hypothetical protein BJL90_12880 [Clostridium formicaceticum]ARE87112.1 hypothetical protein CLFO_14980 [Clostridium formicaceticum]
MGNGFDFSELTKFQKDLLAASQEFEKGKHAKSFLRKQGNKLNKENKKQANKIGKKTGNFMKGFKVGKVYKYMGQDLSIRAYNSSSHAHLLDLGHRIVDKNGKEHGFKEGYHFMEKAKKAVEEGHYKDVQGFIDDMLNKHGL